MNKNIDINDLHCDGPIANWRFIGGITLLLITSFDSYKVSSPLLSVSYGA